MNKNHSNRLPSNPLSQSNPSGQLRVRKRDGTYQEVAFDKITERLAKLCRAYNIKCSYTIIAKKTIEGLYDGITTAELDVLAAETAAAKCLHDTEYDRLAGVITVSNLHKSTGTYTECTKLMRDHKMLNDSYWELSQKYSREIEEKIDYSRDYSYDYSAIKTMMAVILRNINGSVFERPQCSHMRVALALHPNSIEDAFHYYDLLSKKFLVHGTPTHINAGMTNQLSSCFLLNVSNKDGIAGIYKTVRDCAVISHRAGGIGLSVSSIPAAGTPAKDGGKNPGILLLGKVFNDTSKHSQEGGGSRKGASAMYCEQWHADFETFIDMKLGTGKDELRCRDLFLAAWTSDLFMKRVQAGEKWSFFCPSTAPGLDECWGEKFERLYIRYENEGRAVRTLEKATSLWLHMLDNMFESGVPYNLFKDQCNRMSNQNHLGCIKSSNLCTEIIQYSSPEETAVCNLASVSLPAFYTAEADNKTFDHNLLFDVVKNIVYAINTVIDVCDYPTKPSRRSNLRHRPMGIGVSGLADLFLLFRYPFTSPEARKLNVEIFETIYYAFMRTSCDIAKVRGKYDSYEGSLVSKGTLNYMLYNHTPSKRWPFAKLLEDIAIYGTTNSLGTCTMPTSNGSIILGNNESTEPFAANIFVRRVTAGDYIVINKHLERELKKIGLYTPSIKERILKDQGSVAKILEIPEEIRELFKTVWELEMKDLINMAVDRMPFIDQSQSFNFFVETPDKKKLSDMIFYCWNKGLKGSYYLRTKAPLNPALIASGGCTFCAT